MELKGIHHLSALTANAAKNVEFYTEIMGMRLVKKTVNQDDVSVYHLFYGDERGNPGTELTFFEIPMAAPNKRGASSISGTSLRVKNDEALDYWKSRFEQYDVSHGNIEVRAGRNALSFEDFEGQRLLLVSDETNKGVPGGVPWNESPVPQKYGIIGLGPIHLTVRDPKPTAEILTKVMGYRRKENVDYTLKDREVLVFETGKGGTGSEVHIVHAPELPFERQGRGGVHHVAFRVDDEDALRKWISHIDDTGLPNSGFVERYYFRSLYFREPNGILFELATDGPGFDTDEDLAHLGESLALPPYLEPQREQIEAKLKPLDTKRS
ncbi:ring-cleaving dioxygenase [Salicibibacter halophilus]|uniref:Ring-cleaving dioxygenase n=1 Tax=Salicibibacter halophilus TaxID=2502791 RepID=A0A514LKQ5_9BACI|nr:ring-cleaving dioxygenase [Salicibibacter halophilus]QDI92429.1 ring-cleaving dioxygenase [Salicibibacter halophilus]